MKRTLIKDSFREVYKSLDRFISIVLIISLGVGFFAGIKATAPDMKATAHAYYEDQALNDFWLISSMGFEEKDREELSKIRDVRLVKLGHTIDGIIEDGDQSKVVNIKSLPLSQSEYINIPDLKEGRWPEKKGECILEYTSFHGKYKVGDLVSLSSGKDRDLKEDLENTNFRVVGFANSPQHLTIERSGSSIGNGKVSGFMLIGEEEFKSDYYSEAYLKTYNMDNLNSYSDEYKDYLKSIEKDVELAGERIGQRRLDQLKDDLEKDYDKADKEFRDEILKAERELEKARLDLDQAKDKLKAGDRDYKKGLDKLETEIAKGRSRLDQEEVNLNKGQETYERNKADFDKKRPKAEAKIKEGEAGLKELRSAIAQLDKGLEGLKLKLEGLLASQEEEDKEGLEAEIQGLKAEIQGMTEERSKLVKQAQTLEGQLEKGKNELAYGERELAKAKNKIDLGRQEIKLARDRLIAEKKSGEKELSKAKKDLDSAREEISSGEKDYKKGLEELDKERNKGERELRKFRREIDKLEKPEWYIVKRTDTRDYIDFEMAADRIDAVSKIFPIFFFLISLLVCLTTMTRMVDEQRAYIGSLKALGYGNLSIMSKYLLYGFVASILGSAIGLLVGFKVFPTVIFNAYRMMYIMPAVIVEFNRKYALISILAAVLTTGLASYIAVRKELKVVPASLLRPKAPKAGHRIFLEKINFIWKRMKFSHKVTARNIFRYKKRLFMTVIGVAGCTALLLAGFGLKDSIMSISINQFDLISKYQLAIDVNDGIYDLEKDPIMEFIAEDSRIGDSILSYDKLVEAMGKDDSPNYNVNLVVTDSKIEDFILLRDRKTHEPIKLKAGELVITEKLSSLLDLSKGDDIELKIEDEIYKFKVAAITENYAYHYVYMDKELYEKTMGEKIEYNRILTKLDDSSKEFEEKLSKDLLKVEDVTGLTFMTGLSKTLNDMIGSLDYVMMVLIVSAGALAFIVLYNLTNINISERMREIATIKVLGFYDGEVSRYVYRENNILTIIGILLGSILGIFLHRFIILTTEIDMIMFGRNIRPISFVYGGLLTLVFLGLVNFVMHFKLKKIDMVESLKSVD